MTAGRIGLAVVPGVVVGLAPDDGPTRVLAWADGLAEVSRLDAAVGPRWVVWDGGPARALVAAGVRLRRCWDVAAVHRLAAGGWRADPDRVWARAHDLPREGIPTATPDDLFSMLEPAGGATPVRADGYLDPMWSPADDPAEWARLAVAVADRQAASLDATATRTAHAESTAELLCAELEADGLPIDRTAMTAVIETFTGPRPRSEGEAAAIRAGRDAEVLALVPPDAAVDLRSPGQVKWLLRRVGIEVPDTRAWRLRELQDRHPVVGALLAWRKAERIATTYGHDWLDRHVGADDRLRGEWTGCDGAAGRMTASAGLHNLPADLRVGVVAAPGWTFVRTDLGQVEPRVLAVVSGDTALARAATADDLYAPVARELGVDRATAKVAVLGAMYGQTTGIGADAGRRLRRAYPVAMAHLDAADRAAQVGQDVRTHGGRRVRMAPPTSRSQAAAMGRYGRNALVQGAAAELFKQWAATVRARLAGSDAHIALCLHDELLVHAPTVVADEVAATVTAALAEAAARWSGGGPVPFPTDLTITPTWADAKG